MIIPAPNKSIRSPLRCKALEKVCFEKPRRIARAHPRTAAFEFRVYAARIINKPLSAFRPEGGTGALEDERAMEGENWLLQILVTP
jgi:hypothetical protein